MFTLNKSTKFHEIYDVFNSLKDINHEVLKNYPERMVNKEKAKEISDIMDDLSRKTYFEITNSAEMIAEILKYKYSWNNFNHLDVSNKIKNIAKIGIYFNKENPNNNMVLFKETVLTSSLSKIIFKSFRKISF